MLTARLDLDDLGPAWLTARREPAAGVWLLARPRSPAMTPDYARIA
jgi:hypothetical protein